MSVKNEITITIGREKVRAVTQGRAQTSGAVQFDRLRLATIQVFEELLLDDTIQIRRHMEVLGELLYDGIFGGDVGDLLEKKLSEVTPDRLRLQLEFEPDVEPKIASMPWEFLYSPVRQDFLATDVNLVLSRYMPLTQDRETFDQAERPLRALIVISRPKDERTVLAKEVVEKIRSLNVEGQDPVVDVRVVDKPTLRNIEDALKEHKPHIFHFIGHGRFDPAKRTGYLLLVDPETENSDQCDDSTLIDRFRNAQCFPRLVFLHMCEGGITGRDATILQAFSGFSPKLIHARIPSVVAMQYPIKNENARDFSLAFYSTLAEGGSVDEAVQEGRRSLDLHRRSRLFGTPVLYMHSAGGLVLPRPAAPAAVSGVAPGRPSEAQKPPEPQGTGGGAQMPTVSAADLDKVFGTGIQAAQAVSDGGKRATILQKLFKMRNDLSGKSSTEVFTACFQAWQEEQDPELRSVWETVMPVV